MHIVLHEPEIPGNTGNIGRTCAATNTPLHLIEPLGFEITEKNLRRAGLDYWAQLDVRRYRDYEDFLLENFGEPGGEPGQAEAALRQTKTAVKQVEIALRQAETAGKQVETALGQAETAERSEDAGLTERPAGTAQKRTGVSVREPRLWYATTKAKRLYCEADFGPDDYIMFGKESAGIPEEILVDHEDACIRIPMGYGIRSLNLSNAVAVVLYEALRQTGFPGLERQGGLHRLKWK